MQPMEEHRESERRKLEDERPGEPGSEGEGSKETPPPLPDPDDDTPLGDSDQHSTADA
jgi:hypothetical protein